METKPKIKIFDHLGNEFTSLYAMCKHWEISSNRYVTLKMKGLTTQEAIESLLEQKDLK